MFARIRTYSFENIDKFSTAGLVTRLTTDVTNLGERVSDDSAYGNQSAGQHDCGHVHVLLYQPAAA